MRQPGRSAVCAGKNGRKAVKPPVRKVLALSRTFVYTRMYHIKATPHNSKCRYGERGAAVAKPKAQIILDAAKVSAASGGNSEPKQGQRSQSARGFCPRSTMRVPHPDIIEHFGNADAVPQPPERCLSRQAGIVRYCLKKKLSLGGQIYGIKPAWPEGEFYFYLVVLSGQQASSPTNTFHACGMIE